MCLSSVLVFFTNVARFSNATCGVRHFGSTSQFVSGHISIQDDGHAWADSKCGSRFPPTSFENYTFRLKDISFETGICHDDIETLVTSRQETGNIFTFLIKIYLMYLPALLFLETDDYIVSHAAVFPLCNRMTLLSSSTVVLTVS